MKNKGLIRTLAGAIIFSMIFASIPGMYAAADETDNANAAGTELETTGEMSGSFDADENVIHIASVDEFLDFAASCTLDTWSHGKHFILDEDISLEDTDFQPIPTFGGHFSGEGHTIRGLHIDQSFSPTGLFCVLQSGGQIDGLNVEGSVLPEGAGESAGGIVGVNSGIISGCSFTGTVSGKRNVGGIAGKNSQTGVISGCRSSGALFGENMSGGIAGYNLGLISDCTNGMYVNIESTDPSIDLSSIDIDFSLDIAQLTQVSADNVASDTGGIAGYSSGTIEDSSNTVSIGYQHIGYNVGGIVGRSCGHIRACSNYGSVCGRKDVGGIVGQMEPYIKLEVSAGTMDLIETQLRELNDLVDKAANDAQGGSGSIGSRLNSLSSSVGSAVDEASNVRLTADIGTTVTGDGSASSSSRLDGGIDTDASRDSGTGITISHEPRSGSLNIDRSGFTDTDISSSGQAELDRDAVASGIVEANTQIVAAPVMDGLTSAVNGIGSQITMLNSAITGTVGVLADDVRAINAKFGELTESVFDAVSSLENGVSDVITDASDTDVDNITLGKIHKSTNSGTVYGDINTGGIAGAMAIEYELDPEDDVTESLSGSNRKQYEYKAVIQQCSNTGSITGKRSYAGGICGRMDLGLITDCEGYGQIISEDGSYVGGIAGVAGATVRSSFAKCTLSGKKYVGGIVGAGVTEKASGGSSTVAGCYSLVDITDCEQYFGAISGVEAGSFLENYFVSDRLAGINRQSFTGQAEPIDFEQLVNTEKLPETMRHFSLKFVADGETVFTTYFDYGASFEELPKVPQKEGYIGAWDQTELINLHFDTVVTAQYTPYTPGLSSEAIRQDGRPVILAQGDYSGADTLSIEAEPLTPGAFQVHSGSLKNRFEGYFSNFGTKDFSFASANWEVVEQWSVAVPEDGGSMHKLRYLPPDGETKRLRIYVENNGIWENTEYETVGSYMVFNISGANARIAVVSAVAVWWAWALAAVLLLLIIFFFVHFIRKLVKKAKSREKETDNSGREHEENEQGSSAQLRELAVVGAAAQNGGHQAASYSEQELLARALSAEKRLAQAEEELQALKDGGVNASEKAGSDAAKPKKKFKWWIPLVVAAVLIAAAAAVLFARFGFKDDLEAYYMLKTYSEREHLSMELTANAHVVGKELDVQADISRENVDGRHITCIDRGGARLYYCESSVYLEDGSAYSLGEVYPNYFELVEEAAGLYRFADISVSTENEKKIYSVSAHGDSAQRIIELLLPENVADAAKLKKISVQLISENGRLAQVQFYADGSGKNDISFAADLTINDGDKQSRDIPQPVLDAIAAGKTGSEEVSGELVELLTAWGELYGKDSFAADITLSANCGPIVLNSTLQYGRCRFSGQDIVLVKKGSAAVYCSGERICDEHGLTVSADLSSLAEPAKLLDIAYQLAMNSTITRSGSGGKYTYTIALDEEGMANVAYAVSPDVKSQNVTFTSGQMDILVSEGEIVSVDISCNGTIRIGLADTSIAIGCGISPVERDVTIPQQVINALKA